MITDPLKLFAVEYSISQSAMNVRTLAEMVENNLANLGRGRPSDYVPIGLFLTYEQAYDFCSYFRQRLEQESDDTGRTDWLRIREIALGLLPRQLNNLNFDQRQPW
jgi:hypothetical protein